MTAPEDAAESLPEHADINGNAAATATSAAQRMEGLTLFNTDTFTTIGQFGRRTPATYASRSTRHSTGSAAAALVADLVGRFGIVAAMRHRRR
ncbi:hypothetical protein [Pseudonocardia yunnanensis]|uniref:Uncharacterized protein n=1 Tax=Pseudonocardia yunnanensis TaxID=58107 RepID=A0ABW4ESK0_9PSEU